jgi:hypothetical protein
MCPNTVQTKPKSHHERALPVVQVQHVRLPVHHQQKLQSSTGEEHVALTVVSLAAAAAAASRISK